MLPETVRAITYDDVLPTIVNQVSNSTVWLARLFGDLVTDWNGASYKVPVRVAKKTNGGSFQGLAPWNTNSTNNIRSMEFFVSAYAEPVVLPGIHKAINMQAGDRQIISYVAEKMDEARESARDTLGSMFYATGLGDDFDGLEVAVDNGTNSTAYGGITRTDYAWMNSSVDSTSTAITLPLLFGAFDNASASSSEQESPTLGLTTKSLWASVENLLAGQLSASYTATSIQGYNKVSGRTPRGTLVPTAELKGAAGFNAISLRGRPIVADDKAPSGTFYWLNENYLEFRSLKDDTLQQVSLNTEAEKGFSQDVPMESPIQFRDLMNSINQHGEIGALLVFGQFVDQAPRRQAKLTNKT